MSDVIPRPRNPHRWAVLLAYLPVVGLSQVLWLNFAHLQGFVQETYGVSNFVAGALIVIFPLLYVFLSVPAGRLIDRRGYRLAVGGGAVVMAVASLIRLASGSFWALLAGQFGIALAQPFIVNGISKVVVDWFEPEERALATGLATGGMFLGIAAGMVTSTALPNAIGLRGALAVYGAASVAAAILFLVVVHPNAAVVSSVARGPAAGLLQLLRNGQIRLLIVLIFLGAGEFNGLAIVLEQLLGANGISATEAANVGAVLVAGGAAGAVVIPGLASRLGRRRPFLIVAVGIALVTLGPICAAHYLRTIYVLAAVHGFFFLPAVTLLLDLAAEVAGAESAGTSTSLLMLAGNAGGLVITFAAILMMRVSDTRPVVLLFIGALAVASALGVTLTDPQRTPAVEPA